MAKARPDIPEFWAIADPMIAEGRAEEGTMMGFRCLRVNGGFFATADHRNGDLVIKLPTERVDALIADGTGQPFAPAGRRFREWVAVPRTGSARWPELIGEARAFVAGA